MGSFLIRRLILPLLIATVVSFALCYVLPEPWAGFMVNLSAGFLGTICTVLYVDAVLRRHEAVEWSAVRVKVRRRAVGVAASCVFPIRRAACGEGNPRSDVGRRLGEPAEKCKALLDVIDLDIIEALPRLREWPPETWRELATDLEKASDGANRVLSAFGPHLSVALTDRLLNVQQLIGAVCALPKADCRRAAPEHLAASSEGSPAAGTQDHFHTTCEQRLRALLTECAALIRTGDDDSND